MLAVICSGRLLFAIKLHLPDNAPLSMLDAELWTIDPILVLP